MRKIIFLIFATAVLLTNCSLISQAPKNPLPPKIHAFVTKYQKPITVNLTGKKQIVTADLNGFYIGKGLIVTAYHPIFDEWFKDALHKYKNITIDFDAIKVSLGMVNVKRHLVTLRLSSADSLKQDLLNLYHLFAYKKDDEKIRLYEKIYFVGRAHNIKPYIPHIGMIESRIIFNEQEEMYFTLNESTAEIFFGAPVFNSDSKIIGIIIGRSEDTHKAIMVKISQEDLP